MIDVFKYFGGKDSVRREFADVITEKLAAGIPPRRADVMEMLIDVSNGDIELVTYENMKDIMSPLGIRLEDVFCDFTIPAEDEEDLCKLAEEIGFGPILATRQTPSDHRIPETPILSLNQKLKLLVLLHAFQQL
jgi:hypothetical protein